MPSGFHWDSSMVLVLLQFVFFQIFNMQNSFACACVLAATIFKIKKQNVARLAKMYLSKIADPDTTDCTPDELPRKKCGWGAASFAAKKDEYCIVKEEHLKAVATYVTERNTSMKGLCTVNAIIAHLYQKFGIEFKYRTIHYALTTRLGLRYRTPLKRRLVFAEGRTKLGIQFCLDYDHALKEERAGRAVIVRMDETYCHTHHMPSRCWCGDAVGRVERSRSKGSLTIILHAMTKDGWLLSTNDDGTRPSPKEFESGEVLNSQMIWRGKIGRGDYHDNMDGDMFQKWLQERLVPTFQAKYPGKVMYLVMDNAPYHHVHPADSFFASSHNKDEIKDKLVELGVDEITVTPFGHGAQWKAPPSVDAVTSDFDSWLLFERSTGICWFVDGLSNEGFGDVIVYAKVGNKKFGAVESSLVDDFRRLLESDFGWIGHGEHALRFIRQSGMLNARGRVKQAHRQRGNRIRDRCRAFFETVKDTTFTYPTADCAKTYNGGGQRGTGGPKGKWLEAATDLYIAQHHPELRMTKVVKLFMELGWFIIFTVPYWARSQPIELAWAYVKNYVARRYHPGRTSSQLRQHILEGMYGSPDGKHTGLTPHIAQKLILTTHKYINEFLVKQPELNGRGYVGDLSTAAELATTPAITAPVGCPCMGAMMGPINH